jgi:hypothetical protein
MIQAAWTIVSDYTLAKFSSMNGLLELPPPSLSLVYSTLIWFKGFQDYRLLILLYIFFPANRNQRRKLAFANEERLLSFKLADFHSFVRTVIRLHTNYRDKR